MFLNKPFPFTKLYKIHLIIAGIGGCILAFILIFLQPFETVYFQHQFKNLLLFGYSIFVFIGYLIFHFLENLYFKKYNSWNWGNEIAFRLGSGFFGILMGYFYHTYVFSSGSYSIYTLLLFIFYICLPILPLVEAPILLLRYIMIKELGGKEVVPNSNILEEKTLVSFTNYSGKEELVVPQNALIYVSSLDNYVQFYYLDDDKKTHKKIIRNTLSNVQDTGNFLTRIHRSYLVNINYIKQINGNSQKSTLSLDYLEEQLPVSKSQYKNIKNTLSSRHKT
ncbi:LytR/AlgR family response regulator transcription factor [Aquimarina algiphila]|uniref:LytR/AlgR family response regulator transcription factor n=1 Tax=Aquimarina algiphila TaxID=2047982 RepID=UPI0024911D0E|nr:LytTR family DNA-binding domain-containing protein [Aquimarina algiphila]